MKLIDLFPSWMVGGGIFAKMNGVPWDGDPDVNKIALDLEYFGNRSGDREISPLLMKMVAPENGDYLSNVEVDRVINVIKNTYGDTWVRLWELRKAEYNPLENYNMREQEDISGHEETAKSIEEAQTDESTQTGSGTSKTTENKTDTVEHHIDIVDRTETDGNGSNRISHNVDESETTAVATDNTKTTKQKSDLTVEAKHKIDTTETRTDSTMSLGATAFAPASKSVLDRNGSDTGNVDTTHTTGSADNNVIEEHNTGAADKNVTTVTKTAENGDVVTDVHLENTDYTHKADGTKNKDVHRSIASGDDNKTEVSSTNTVSGNKQNNTEETGETRKTEGRTLTRSGNIGVTTSQQMAQSEIELWKWHFFDTVFEDVNKILTIPYWRLYDV